MLRAGEDTAGLAGVVLLEVERVPHGARGGHGPDGEWRVPVVRLRRVDGGRQPRAVHGLPLAGPGPEQQQQAEDDSPASHGHCDQGSHHQEYYRLNIYILNS